MYSSTHRVHSQPDSPPKHQNLPPQPWTLEQARRFTAPFGLYKGVSLAEVAKTERGRSYLAWVNSAVSTRNFAIAAGLVLKAESEAQS